MSGTRQYILPCAPVSVNDAYKATSGYVNARSRVYMSSVAADFKRYCIRELERQDQGWGKSQSDVFWFVRWVHLYTEDEYFSDALPTSSRALQQDPVFRDRDVSNGIKLAEDALFEYLEQRDCRVVSFSACKVPVKTLPRPPHAYAAEAWDIGFAQGNILLEVTAHPIGELLQTSTLELAPFANLLSTTSYEPLRERAHPTLDVRPSWARLPDLSGTHADQPMSAYAEALAARGADEDTEIAQQTEAMRVRLAYWLRWHQYGHADAEKLWHRAGRTLRVAYAAFKKGKLSEEDWWTHPSWHAEMLTAECSFDVHARLREAAKFLPVAIEDGDPPYFLVVGDPAGTYSQFLRDLNPRCHITLVDWPEHARRVRARVPTGLRSIEQSPRAPLPAALGTFDAALVMDIAHTVDDPRVLLRDVCSHLRPAGRLVASWDYRARRARAAHPWVRNARVGSVSMSQTLTPWLSGSGRRDGLGLTRVPARTSDLVLCCRPPQ